MTQPGLSDDDPVYAPAYQAYPGETWRCPICQRGIHASHFKRHLGRHDRELGDRAPANRAWLAFLRRRVG